MNITFSSETSLTRILSVYEDGVLSGELKRFGKFYLFCPFDATPFNSEFLFAVARELERLNQLSERGGLYEIYCNQSRRD